MTQYSLAQLTVLEASPPELIRIAAAAGYDLVGLRLLEVTGGDAWPLTTDPAMLREIEEYRPVPVSIVVRTRRAHRIFLDAPRCGRRLRGRAIDDGTGDACLALDCRDGFAHGGEFLTVLGDGAHFQPKRAGRAQQRRGEREFFSGCHNPKSSRRRR